MKKLLAVTLIIWGFISCQKSEHQGYSLSRSGLDYKMIILGDERQLVLDSDMVNLNVNVFTLNDSNLFSGQISKMYIPKNDTGIQEILGMLAVGDSASIYMESSKLNGFLPLITNQRVRVELGLESKSNYTSWMFYHQYPELSKDLEIEEQLGLLQLLRDYQSDSIEVVKGMFLIREVVGKGALIKSKDEVSVHYTAQTIDGKILDSTYDRNEPFSFIIGQQGQVLPGFEIGIRKMRNGGKATFIIPSELAFGSKGSSTGIAKGYQTLIYQVEIIDVNVPEKNN